MGQSHHGRGGLALGDPQYLLIAAVLEFDAVPDVALLLAALGLLAVDDEPGGEAVAGLQKGGEWAGIRLRIEGLRMRGSAWAVMCGDSVRRRVGLTAWLVGLPIRSSARRGGRSGASTRWRHSGGLIGECGGGARFDAKQ